MKGSLKIPFKKIHCYSDPCHIATSNVSTVLSINVSEVFLGNHGLHVKWLAISLFEGETKRYTSSQTNVARENRPFVDVLPIQKKIFNCNLP